MKDNTPLPVARGKVFAIAPMMDWTDRHCRYFHRQLTRHALLYTEMVTAHAVVRGNRQKLLGFDLAEQPLALQLGGSDPHLLAEAARIGEDFGYREINLNIGCPSGKVQEGRFGACLMADPDLVAECVAAMRQTVRVPVTVKCRIGIDDQDEESDLQHFIEKVAATGCDTFVIHARKAWLQGLSPKENREIPPLDYARVHRLKASLPHLRIILNGGLESVPHAIASMGNLDGVMLGRAAYHTPWTLIEADPAFNGSLPPVATRHDVVDAMQSYVMRLAPEHMPLHRITRHMLGLFHAQPGGRLWRQILSTEACRRGAGWETVQKALAAITSRESATLEPEEAMT